MHPSRKRKLSPSSEDAKEYNIPLWNKQQFTDMNLVPSVDQLKTSLNFDKILDDEQTGPISKPVFVGMLLAKRADMGRYLFEFECNCVMFDAFTTKSHKFSDGIFNNLKIGFSYMLSGKLSSCKREEKYSHTSNNSAKIMLYIYKLANYKCADTTQTFNQLDKPTLKILNEKIQRGEKFAKEIDGLEIVGGSVQRYLGCNKCSYSLMRAEKSGETYRCQMCEDTETSGFDQRTKEVCVNIWDLQLKDREGNVLEGAVLHQKQCSLLFGDDAILQARDVLADQDVAIAQILTTFGDTKFSCTIKHSVVAQGNRGLYKVTVENLKITHPPYKQTVSVDARPVSYQDEVFTRNLNRLTRDVSRASLNANKKFTCASDHVYTLNETSEGYIGLVLIVNIMGKGKNKRKGSEKDVEVLEKLFPELRVKVFKGKAIQDIGREKFLEELTEFKEELIRDRYSSSFVVVMSHGELLNLQLAEGEEIQVYEDVVKEFGEKQFEEFDGRPKIFIFHGCQGYPSKKTIHLSDEIDQSQRNPDVLLCFPCDPGVLALRNTETGTYFIQIMAEVLRSERNNTHLLKMMLEVQDRVSKVQTELPITNVPCINGRIFGKFYFPEAEADRE